MKSETFELQAFLQPFRLQTQQFCISGRLEVAVKTPVLNRQTFRYIYLKVYVIGRNIRESPLDFESEVQAIVDFDG